jgi:EmrB/QacA subfamily drug resistance transporter
MTPVRLTTEQLTEHRPRILAITSAAAFMMSLGNTITAVALPAISRDLDLTFGASLWVQASYLTATAVLLIPLGRLADRRGLSRSFVLALAVYAATSLLSGLSLSGMWLICARIAQGGGAALAMTTSVALIAVIYPVGQRGKAMGIWVMAAYLGQSTAPTLGGLLVDGPGWRWIFFVNVPIALALLVWGWRLLPLDQRGRKVTHPDPLGALFLAVFLIALLVPMTFSAQWGWASVPSVLSLAFAALALVGLVLTELRVKDPMLDLDLIRRNRAFATSNLAALLTYMSFWGPTVLTAVFLEVVQGRSAALTGVSMVAAPLTQALLAPFAGRLTDRVDSRVLTSGGMLASALGLGVLATLTGTSGLGHVIVGLVLVSVGIGLFSTPNNTVIVSCVPLSQVGVASAFLNTTRTIGQAVSVGVLGGIAASALGAVGTRIIFLHGTGSGSHLTQHAADGFAKGYSTAMWAAMGLALASAAASLLRGPSTSWAAARQPAVTAETE